MRTVFTLLIVSAILLASCSSPDWKMQPVRKTAIQVYKQVPSDFFPRKYTVVSAGDSLTQGVGDSTQNGGYLPYLKTKLEQEKGISEVEFHNYGVKGNVTTQLLKRLHSQELKTMVKHADMVIITIGGNDIMEVVQKNISNLQVSAFMKEKEVYISHLSQIFDTITQENPNITILLVGIYNPFMKYFANVKELNQIVDDWNRASRTVVANYQDAYFVDIEDLFVQSNINLLYTDHFHPNDKGYKLIAERLFDSMEERALPDLERKAYTVSKEEKLKK
jgi:lysophospholipase L1-like esterase